MFGTVTIGGHDIELLANAATPIRFNQVFKTDLVKFFVQLEKGEVGGTSPIVTELAYTMYAQAAKLDFDKINVDTFFEWLEQFGPVDFVEAGSQIVDVFYKSMPGSVESKKKESKQRES